jgi:hypothetical protein
MAARLNPRHAEMVREKIRASQLVNRLEDHALGEAEMSATQVSAALGLLKKVVPDLSAQQISGDADNPLAVQASVTVEYVDPATGGVPIPPSTSS